MSDSVSNFSEKEMTGLVQLKERLQDVLQAKHDDYDLLRWLRARDFNVEKSEQMFRKSLEWRLEMGADTILDDYTPPEVCVNYCIGDKTYFVGQDKQGSIIRILCPGRLDLKGLLKSLKKNEMHRYMTYQMEGAMEHMKELGTHQRRRIDQVIHIADLEGFGLKNLWKPGVEVLKKNLTIMEENYPEMIKKMFIINAPAIFPVFFAIISPFLSPRTKNKMKILGKNYQTDLLKHIDDYQLPVKYGGTKMGIEDDPSCSHLICYGGLVPDEYYLKMDPERLESCTEISVGRKSYQLVEIQVNVAESVLRWQFTTEGYDIGFGVFLKISDSSKTEDMKTVLGTERANSHVSLEEGCITCSETGTYVLHFDNTYSWTRVKVVKYTVDVLEPTIDILETIPTPDWSDKSDNDAANVTETETGNAD